MQPVQRVIESTLRRMKPEEVFKVAVAALMHTQSQAHTRIGCPLIDMEWKGCTMLKHGEFCCSRGPVQQAECLTLCLRDEYKG